MCDDPIDPCDVCGVARKIHNDDDHEFRYGNMSPLPTDQLRDAAYDYFRAVGITDPPPDAIGQLTDAFLPALRIICERGYDPEGRNWRQKGWRGLVHDILDNAYRIKDRSWHRREFYANGALDLINFAGFYLRLKNQGPAWGTWGEPN